MNRTVLVIAFHFPPIASSSGMQRSLKVVRYLHEDGWRPVVLTVSTRAYSQTNSAQLSEIPPDVPVHRAFGLDATRHFAIGGRYPGCLAWPDPWASWWPAACWTGRLLIRRFRPGLIWSTFPITTTNLVALHLAKWSRLPWIADLRDPITLDGYPVDPMRYRLARWIERRTVEHATRLVFAADYTRRIYTARYPSLDSRSIVIPNGYDEANFPANIQPRSRQRGQRTLVHSGALQPAGRDPRAFFQALSLLKQRGRISASNFQVVLRGCGFASRYRPLAEQFGVADLVAFPDYLPYAQAIAEMVESDGLLVFQGTRYNHTVPAKVYEYFFARRPILALLDKSGETRRVLEDVGVKHMADIADADDIADLLDTFLHGENDNAFLPRQSAIACYSRRVQTQKLAALMAQAIEEGAVNQAG